MVFSSVHAHDDLGKYPSGIKRAIEYLMKTDFMKMETGIYPIEGNALYAMVMDIETKHFEEKRPESHKKYVDVQYIVSGKERQGFAPDCGQAEIVDYKEENDIYFYDSISNEGFLIAEPGCYSIFYPNDLHRPGCCVDVPEKVRKVVVKVSTDLLT